MKCSSPTISQLLVFASVRSSHALGRETRGLHTTSDSFHALGSSGLFNRNYRWPSTIMRSSGTAQRLPSSVVMVPSIGCAGPASTAALASLLCSEHPNTAEGA